MANFDARIRVDYADMDGLVLDCRHSDLTPSRWISRAPPGSPRFGDPYQDDPARQPVISTVGGYKQAQFTRVNSHFFKLPLEESFPVSAWTVAFEYFQGSDNSNLQTVLGFDVLEVFRRDATGVCGFRYDVMSAAGAGDLQDGTWMLAHLDATGADLHQNGMLSLPGPGVPVAISAGDPAGFIGCADGVSRFCDMALRGVQIWNRLVAPLEVDFAFQSLSAEHDHSQDSRATVSREIWTDNTDVPSRINPSIRVPHRFVLAKIPPGQHRRVQIAATVDGIVKPDSALGGDLFSLVPVELPGAPPCVYQTPGWSAVFDVVLDTVGHHTFVLNRQNGGALVIHLDVGEE